ncbi:MAG TPA: hypothetical protein VGO11_12695 [Chthoniobacteraceae bacterium]|jgi:hypothetical protein|nr:hypothetical protein [Chthoniobacteraceae bacterium]
MNTPSEFTAAQPRHSPEELPALRSVREEERTRDRPSQESLLEIVPVDLGPMLKPFGPDDDIFGEMIDAKRS